MKRAVDDEGTGRNMAWLIKKTRINSALAQRKKQFMRFMIPIMVIVAVGISLRGIRQDGWSGMPRGFVGCWGRRGGL
jgi:hypothetical protein